MEKQKENAQVSPKIDVVFKMLFGEPANEKATIGLLEDVIKEKIDTINLDENPYLLGEQVDDKVRNYRHTSENKQ